MLAHSALFAISAAILAYEVLLVRLLSIVQWHHFAYMAISIALLGFGISGTLLTLARSWLAARSRVAFVAAASLFALTAVAGFLLVQRLPFNALEIIWEPSQLIYLGAMYGLLAVPFTGGAVCIGLAFLDAPGSFNQVYLWNLVGSGAGAIGIVLALWLITPIESLLLVGAVGLLAGLLRAVGHASRAAYGVVAGALVVGAAAWVAAPAEWTKLRLSEYKALSTALRVKDARLLHEYSGPLGLVVVVESPTVPFRYAPGLSLMAPSVPSDQIGVFVDGGSFTAIERYDGESRGSSHLAYTTDAVVYALTERPRVLVLGAGGGAGVLQAVQHGAAAIDAVEVNPHLIRLVRVDHAEFAGRIYERPDTRIHLADARSFLAATPDRWDVIQVPPLDAAGGASGVQGLSESHVYTVEAFQSYLDRLRPDGWLSLTQWLRLPPRDALRLVATATAALERQGASDPGEQLVAIRGPSTTTVLVKHGAVTSADIAAIREFVAARAFDVAYYPGMPATEANRRNILSSPFLFDGTRALLGPGRDSFIDRYKFDISPATDDRPYFFDFFKWRTLPELLALRRVGGGALVDWSEAILFATLIQAVLLSALLVLLPLRLGLRRGNRRPFAWRVGGYFVALGLAFLFVEIAYIQRFLLFLGHPVHAVAVVLAGFLLFAGLGSGASAALSRRLRASGPARVTAVDFAAFAIIAIALLYLFALQPIFGRLAGLPDIGRAAVSLALIAPLAFFMGMPFPLGLAGVSRTDPRFVPWAWGVNGCASVVSAVLATILAMQFGFTVVILIAAGLYAAAAITVRPILLRP